ncbi:HD-GYP domain-containing protein [Paenibacillus beijingensis]|uniref:Metal-dependent phosphohydrolase n=1 Tax=Paenibacillus beijingensis TaxID=1126833 RepID=A0A0D5NKB8_9BACL|nr:HD-GYP domain-containing protein [Paenibacillus beijingensis]AJY75676.1 metal-dependent phosphohydrolase [Paenibacillus beijingensis]
MKKVHLNSIQQGERLAKPIFQENGNVLLGAGVELTDRFIQRLTMLGIDMVYIEDAFTEGIVPVAPIRDETRKQAAGAVYKTVNSLVDLPANRGRAMSPETGRTFRTVFRDILNDLITREDVLVSLSDIHVTDAYLFQHSVNVAVLAGVMGIAKGYNRQQLEELGIGAMLFDIGMTQVPKELLNKKGDLTPQEKEMVQRHTVLGYDLIRKQHDISLLSAHCALQHHERYDGTGYPRQVGKDAIHMYAQIVGLADVYTALTSARPYRKRYTPSEAIEYLFAAGGTHFNLDLIKLFCSHISIYPISTTVLLNSGQVGVVSANNPVALHRPLVRIIREPDGSAPSAPYELDLKEELHLNIVNEM